jgi:hypothetical protein
MFSNIGSKIQKLAKFVCWAGIILFIIAGIGYIVAGDEANGIYPGIPGAIAGIIVMVVGSVCSWLSSLCLYGFGTLIVKAESIDSKLSK